MIQGRGSAGFTAEAFEGLRIVGDIVREKLQSNKTAELSIFSLIDNAHATATELFGHTVVRNSLS
jgi:hypothetical protein